MARGIKYATEEERKEASRAAHRRWRERNDRLDYYKEYYNNLTIEQKETIRERNRKAREADPDKARKASRDSYHRNKHNKTRSRTKESVLYSNAKKRSKLKNLPFDLDVEDIKIPSVCPCCKSEMVQPSVDQIKPAQGYLKSNIAIICYECNIIKSFGTAERHRQIAEWMDSLD